ncbi:MAG TPA: hypothetical protein VGV67_01250, partial [Solirubrobacteraceae bacterium]|nr:hypothetical protein [Solirubrobacteraceae bacterium]
LTSAAVAAASTAALILVGLGNSMTMTSNFLGQHETNTVSLGWAVPVVSALWSGGWAYMAAVWRRPVVVVEAPSDGGAEG